MPTSKPRHFRATSFAFAALTATLLVAVSLSGIVRGDETAAKVAPATPESLAFFETKIRPVLIDNCVSCHGKNAQIAGLRVDSREALLKGGDSGASLVPGDAAKSLLVQVIKHAGKIKMPQGGKLKDSEIADIEAWVAMGAPWTPSVAAKPSEGESKPAKPAPVWWSLKPVTSPPLPPVKNAAWAQSPIDRFVLARLEAAKLAPAPDADRRTLLRRVTYDLTGLPPTPADTAAFVADKRLDAYETVVNRLLVSPRYGERMARLWLDVARYADTKGYVFEEDRNYPNAYTYRDWVINAFNRDIKFAR